MTSLEVLSTTKILLSGDNGYIALSKDGGNIVTPQLLPIEGDFSINDIAMKNAFVGIIVGDNGTILYTENGGEDSAVGFEIIDLSDFSEFVDFTKDNLLEGLKATVKIVIFGILLGFFIGIALAMCKTAPTTLKQMIEGDLERTLTLFWVIIPSTIFCIRIYGLGLGILSLSGLIILFSLLYIFFARMLCSRVPEASGSYPEGSRKQIGGTIKHLVGLPLAPKAINHDL